MRKKKKEEDPEIVEDGDGKKPEDSKNIVKSIHGPSFGTTYNYSPRQLEYGNNAFFLPRSNSGMYNKFVYIIAIIFLFFIFFIVCYILNKNKEFIILIM